MHCVSRKQIADISKNNVDIKSRTVDFMVLGPHWKHPINLIFPMWFPKHKVIAERGDKNLHPHVLSAVI